MKRIFAFFALAAIILAGATSCKDKFKTDGYDYKISTHVFTKDGVDVGEEIATIHGELAFDIVIEGDLWERIGFEWGTDPKLASGTRTVMAMDAEGEGDDTDLWRGFRSNIFPLTPGTRYYYRAFIIIDGEKEYGQIFSFITPARQVTDVIVDPPSGIIEIEESTTLQLSVSVYPTDATDLSVTWKSENTSVATVSQEGLVTAKSEGQAIIRATSNLTPSKSGTCTIKVIGPPPENSVDMGLPSGVRWRDRNLGADSPSAKGRYYAWAETGPKNDYSSETYVFKGDGIGIDYVTKYNGNGSWGNGGDGRIFLKDGNYEDDAARAALGGSWRIPSGVEWNELRDNCTISIDRRSGVDGVVFTAKNPDKKGNKNSLFFPFGGRMDGTGSGFESDHTTYSTSQGYYWTDEVSYYISSSQYYYVYAYCMHFFAVSGEPRQEFYKMFRAKGLMIRPVCS